MTDILNEDGEYFSRMRYLENEQKRVTDALDQDAAMCVDDLLDEKAVIGQLRECACFRAGFWLALELVR